MSLNTSLVLLAVVLLMVAIVRLYRAGRTGRLRWWGHLAQAHRLTFTQGKDPHEAVLRGVYKGVRVEISLGGGRLPPALSLFTRIVAELPGAAPPGLLITSHAPLLERLRARQAPQLAVDDPELGGAFTIQGFDEEKTVEVVRDPSVRDPLVALRKRVALIHVNETSVQIELQGIAGPELPQLVELTARAAAGISESYERAWADFAKDHGMVFLGAGTRGDRTLRGYLNGSRVTIQTGPMPENPEIQFSTIKVSIGMRLPAGLRVLPRAFSPHSRGEIELGVPKLDEIIRVQGTNREAVKALLTQPAVRDHLLGFYQVCPYTMIEGGQVIAGGPGLLGGDLLGQVAAVDELAGTLREAWSKVDNDPNLKATGS